MGNRSVVIYGGELYHHGILGQKWGVKNGPPYPLGSEDHSQREKKAGWRKSLATNVSTVYKKVKRASPPGVKTALNILERQSRDTTFEIKKKTNNLKDKWNGLSDKQKKAIKIGAAVAVSALAAYGIYRVVKANGGVTFVDPNGNARNALTDLTIKEARTSNIISKFLPRKVYEIALSRRDTNSYTYTEPQVKSLSDLAKWPPGQNTPDNCMEIINRQLSGLMDGKDFQSLSYGEQVSILNHVPVERTQNCMFCTTAYELNRRGIKCMAGDRYTGGFSFQVADMFKITDKKAIMTYDFGKGLSSAESKAKNILKAYTSNYPDGARGNLIVSWKQGGGHSMAWEIINGKFTVLDTQTGVKYDTTSKVVDLLSRTKGQIQSIRTDNAELNENAEALLKAILPSPIYL